MKTLIRYLKQFGAWVTVLTDNYRFNPFIQATIHIIAIQVILGLLLVAISGWAIQYAQNNTIGSISYHIQQAVNGTPNATASLPEAISHIRAQTLVYLFVGLICLIGLFSYLLIRFALIPTRDALQIQKRFIGNIAHEVRTPLAIIKTSTEVALMDPELHAPLRATLNDTIVELNRISEIINNLLSFDTLLRPGRIKTELVDMGAIVNMVVSRHQALAASRGVMISVRMCNERHIMGNPSALEQVITNLIKNAINYTPQDKKGTVLVSIENDSEKRVVVAIIDSGIGIAQKDLYHVFEPFYRGDTSRARGIGTGTSGLGLAIVNEIVRLHRGSISIKSAVSQGTTVAITFPPAPESSKQLVPPLAEMDDGVHEVSVDFS